MLKHILPDDLHNVRFFVDIAMYIFAKKICERFAERFAENLKPHRVKRNIFSQNYIT